MCNQAVCLLAAAIESAGIATVSVILLREIAEKVGVPRGLAVPFPLGYPLGRPNDPALQQEVMRQAFAMLGRKNPGIEEFRGAR